MTFTTSRLTGERVLVRGTDVFGTTGSTVLDSSQWTEVNSRKEFSQATDEFDAAVQAFFAPLTEAAEKINKKLEKPTDACRYVVLRRPRRCRGEAGAAGQADEGLDHPAADRAGRHRPADLGDGQPRGAGTRGCPGAGAHGTVRRRRAGHGCRGYRFPRTSGSSESEGGTVTTVPPS